MRFCLGQIVKTKAEFLELAKQSIPEYDLIELWLDFITDWDANFLQDVCQEYAGKLILLTRRNDQLESQLTPEQRRDVLTVASQYPILIDLDFHTQQTELHFWNSLTPQAELLLSYHNYQLTPEYSVLKQMMLEMLTTPAHLYKIACFCNSTAELLTVLRLKEDFTTDKNNLIVLGAGEAGLLSRLACYLQKQPIIYAPKSSDQMIIKGQLCLKQYRLFEEMLNAR